MAGRGLTLCWQCRQAEHDNGVTCWRGVPPYPTLLGQPRDRTTSPTLYPIAKGSVVYVDGPRTRGEEEHIVTETRIVEDLPVPTGKDGIHLLGMPTIACLIEACYDVALVSLGPGYRLRLTWQGACVAGFEGHTCSRVSRA